MQALGHPVQFVKERLERFQHVLSRYTLGNIILIGFMKLKSNNFSGRSKAIFMYFSPNLKQILSISIPYNAFKYML